MFLPFKFFIAFIAIANSGTKTWYQVDGWTSQQMTLEKSGSSMISADGNMTFTFTPTKSLSSISTATLSLSGFRFIDITMYQFHTQIYTNNTASVQIYLNIYSTTTIAYLNSPQVQEYIYYQTLTFDASNAMTLYASGSQQIKAAQFSLPSGKTFGNRYVLTYLLNFVSFKAQVVSARLRIRRWSTTVYKNNQTIRVQLETNYGSISQVVMSVIYTNMTAASFNYYPLDSYGTRKDCPPVSSTFWNVYATQQCETIMTNYLQIDPIDNMHQNTFLGFAYIALSSYTTPSERQFSFDFTSNGIQNFANQIHSSMDYFAILIYILRLGECDENDEFMVPNDRCVTCELPPNCQKCKWLTTCAKCLPGYYINNDQKCQACSISNCIDCVSSDQCIDCDIGYLLENYQCIPCSDKIAGCSQCIDQSTCTLCNPEFYPTGATCTLCADSISNCESCTSSASCSSCQDGSIKVVDDCLSCADFIPFCNDCSDSSTCLGCIQSHYFIGGTCVECTDVLSYCIQCDDYGGCNKCQSQQYFIQSGQCKLCSLSISSCQLCQIDGLTCTKCLTGFYLQNNSCLSCSSSMAGCQKCLSSSKCIDESSSSQDQENQDNGKSDQQLKQQQAQVRQKMAILEEDISSVQAIVVTTAVFSGGAVVGLAVIGILIFKKVTAMGIGAGTGASAAAVGNGTTVTNTLTNTKPNLESFESRQEIMEHQFNTIDINLND